MKKIYAIQIVETGQVIDFCETAEQANYWLSLNSPKMELVPTNVSHIVVSYTELGGPHGYGHSEISFETYGGITRCLTNLLKWVQREMSVWGPDLRDIKNFLEKCSIYVNEENKTIWWLNQIKKIKGINI